MMLPVDRLEREQNQGDEVEKKAGHVADPVLEPRALLRLADAPEEPPLRDERRNDDQAAERDGQQREPRADVASEVTQLAVRLVVPDEVVDAERDEDEQENPPRVAQLDLRAFDRDRLRHATPTRSSRAAST